MRADPSLTAAERLDLFSEYSNNCLVWWRATRNGYGVMNLKGKVVYCHRLACEIAHGPAPEGKPNALHRCDNKPCIQPDHLYWGDQSDNIQDAYDRGQKVAYQLAKTACKSGHPFTEVSTLRDRHGHRHCRICHQRWSREYHQRKAGRS